ncbi:MAG: aldose 1-epimerase family protein [Planctomycetota bacterium]
MDIRIASRNVSASFIAFGAEVRSMAVNGKDYLWTADPAVWNNVAPILFPIVGGLKNDRYTHDGQSYSMQKHGFARRSEFAVIRQEADHAAFRLTANDSTREQYPFEFVLDVAFTIPADSTLRCDYAVRNAGNKPMPFVIGSHPAVKVPFAGGSYRDYRIQFETKEDLNRYSAVGILLSDEPTHRLGLGDEIDLDELMFEKDAWVFKNLRSRSVSVVHKGSGRRVSMDTGGAPHIGFWAKTRAAYVCLEPWYGYNDPVSADGVFAHKDGMITLQPGEQWTTYYTLTVK